MYQNLELSVMLAICELPVSVPSHPGQPASLSAHPPKPTAREEETGVGQKFPRLPFLGSVLERPGRKARLLPEVFAQRHRMLEDGAGSKTGPSDVSPPGNTP